MSQILITRPWPAARQFRTALALRGLLGLIEPLLTIMPYSQPLPELQGCRAVILTSAAAVEHLPYASLPTGWVEWPCYTVGDNTARIARQKGWRNVFASQGDAAALAQFLLAQAITGAWLYPCGAERMAEPEASLRVAGYDVRVWEVYRAVATTALSSQAQAALQAGTISAITFFSPRTARLFTDLVTLAGLVSSCQNIQAVCLSDNIAQAAAGLPWQSVVTAAKPQEAALLTSLQNYLRR